MTIWQPQRRSNAVGQDGGLGRHLCGGKTASSWSLDATAVISNSPSAVVRARRRRNSRCPATPTDGTAMTRWQALGHRTSSACRGCARSPVPGVRPRIAHPRGCRGRRPRRRRRSAAGLHFGALCTMRTCSKALGTSVSTNDPSSPTCARRASNGPVGSLVRAPATEATTSLPVSGEPCCGARCRPRPCSSAGRPKHALRRRRGGAESGRTRRAAPVRSLGALRAGNCACRLRRFVRRSEREGGALAARHRSAERALDRRPVGVADLDRDRLARRKARAATPTW